MTIAEKLRGMRGFSMKDSEVTRQIVNEAGKNWFWKWLRCIFLRKHVPTYFWSKLNSCFYHQCAVCGKFLGVDDESR